MSEKKEKKKDDEIRGEKTLTRERVDERKAKLARRRAMLWP